MIVMTISALEKICPTLLDGFVVPSGIDRNLFLNNLKWECGELSMVYLEPIYLKDRIADWSKRRLPSWEKILEALTIEYSPIENYNRIETWKHSTDENENTTTNTSAHQSGETSQRESTEVTATNNSTAETKKYEGSFPDVDGLKYNERESSQMDNSGSQTASSNSSESSSLNSSQLGSGERTAKRVLDDIGNVHGNIGVTTNQQMISAEVELRSKDLFDIIIGEFKEKFCLLVY